MTTENNDTKAAQLTPYIVILGTAQDGGYPQAGCIKECCKEAWNNPGLRRLVNSIAIIDPATKERWLIDITPDFKEQLHILEELLPTSHENLLSGIFLTHGHIGHYAGLLNLGREVMNTKNVSVFAMPMMLKFLKANAPWNQLLIQNNIKLNPLKNKVSVPLNKRINVTPFLVPHRDELTETVGFKITGHNKTAVFIPDIDYWNENTLALINKADIAFVDGTFYSKNEIPERDIKNIPHPFIEESMQVLKKLSQKNKIYFIHLNHTNPVLLAGSEESKLISNNGFFIAQEKQTLEL